jgi:hypothetical protein
MARLATHNHRRGLDIFCSRFLKEFEDPVKFKPPYFFVSNPLLKTNHQDTKAKRISII